MAKAKRRRLAAIEKQNKTIANENVLPLVTVNDQHPELSSLLELQNPQLEYRKQRVIVLIPPLPKKVKESHAEGFKHTAVTDLKTRDFDKKQDPPSNSIEKASGILKLILKHGTWRREKIIGSAQLPESAVASKAMDQHVARRKESEREHSELPVQEAKETENAQPKKHVHEMPVASSDLGMQEFSITLASGLPKLNFEPHIVSKAQNQAVSCKEMEILGALKQNDSRKDSLSAAVAQLVPLDGVSQKVQGITTALQENPNETIKDVNYPGQNVVSQRKVEEKISLLKITISKGNGALGPATTKQVGTPDDVPLGGSGKTHFKNQDLTQWNLLAHDSINVVPSRFSKNLSTTPPATLYLKKTQFPTFHGAISLKKEERVDRIHQKLEKAGGLQNWLVKLGLGQFVKIFQEKNIEISQLLDLDMGALKQMGTAAVGPRRKLIHAIDSLS